MKGYLYLQSEYSFLDNLISIEDLVKKSKEKGYDFIALSDPNLHAFFKLFRLAKENNLKPILGLKIDVILQGLIKSSFLVYIKNQKGYKNLLKINKLIIDGINDIETISKNQEGLIFVTAGKDSIIYDEANNKNYDLIYNYLNILKNMFNDFYVGIDLSSMYYKNASNILYNACNKYNLKTIPTLKTSYLEREDKKYYETLKKIDDINYNPRYDYEYKFLDNYELEYIYSSYPQTLEYVDEFVNKIDFDLKFLNFKLPIFDKSKDSNILLKEKVYESLKNKKLDKKYYERADYELEVIKKLNFSDYFLIVADIVNTAKNKKILVGPGRGSSAGSLVSYLLNIVEVDPLEYNLFFERFLNPYRKSMPDIDIDFPDDKREEIIFETKNKYGINHIASIVTFDKFSLKSSIRDVIRVKNYDLDPSEVITSITKNYYDKNDERIIDIIETINKMSGLPRHTGTHASGIVIVEKDLYESLPVMKGPYDFYQVQLEQPDLEKLEVLKIDFLGIRNLSIIDSCEKLIKYNNPNFSIKKISFSDKKTFELLKNADTNGIFQLESEGMQETIKKMQPNEFNDLVDLIALYRPGPMNNLDSYIRRKNGEKFNYIHKDIEDILKSTRGIIIYQEQIMQIASKFAGYNLSEADLFRRAISKKDFLLLEKEKTKFIEGCIKQGYSKQIGIVLFDYIEKFADYGFNKNHSVVYAVVSYTMSYLKANYFLEFAISVLQTIIGNESLTKKYLDELKKKGYKIYPPLVNFCNLGYIVTKKNEIILPITIIKGIGIETAKKFLKERENKKFSSYIDFLVRTNKIFSNKNLENLINSNSLDEFKLSHEEMLSNKNVENADLFKFIEYIPNKSDLKLSMNDKIKYEKEAYGFNIFYNITSGISENILKENKIIKIKEIKNKNSFNLIGEIIKTKEYNSKNGIMAFITITDGDGIIDLTIFSETYQKLLTLPKTFLYVFNVSKNQYKDKITYIINEVKNI